MFVLYVQFLYFDGEDATVHLRKCISEFKTILSFTWGTYWKDK